MAEAELKVKRALLVAPAMEPRGTSEYGLNLARELVRRGVEVALFCAPGPMLRTLAGAEFAVKTFPRLERPLLHLTERKAFRKAADEFKPDVIHLQSAGVLPAGRSLRREADAPMVLTVHCRPARGRAFRRLARRAAGVIATAEFVREELVNDVGVDKAKIRVIPNGIDLQRAAIRESRPIFSSGVPAVGSLGPAEQHRGHELFIEAAAKLVREGSRAQFVVAGQGERLPALRAQVRKLGLEAHVTFVEEFSTYLEVLDALDVVVQSSQVDVSGFSILEAMACGRPVIAFNTGTACELIEDQKTGLLVPRRDAAALTEAMRRLVGGPPLARELGSRARDKVRSNNNIRNVAEKTLSFYSQLVEPS